MGIEELAVVYGEGVLVGIKANKMVGSDGKEVIWYNGSIEMNGELLKNITFSNQIEIELLEKYKPYTFGFQIQQESNRQGMTKNYIKVVYIEEIGNNKDF